MSLSDRHKYILEELTSNPSITSTDLQQEFNLTRRQLGYSIQKINEWLVSNGFPVIERTRQGHFVINQAIFTKFSGNHEQTANDTDAIVLREEERVHLIILMLLSSEEELSLNHFTFELAVSKNTILNDLKQAQKYVEDYDLIIKYSRKFGYLLKGEEFHIRKLLMHMTTYILQMTNGDNLLKKIASIQDNDVTEFKKRVEEVEKQLSLEFTDERIRAMPFIILLILRRIKNGHQLNSFPIEYKELSNTKEYKATEELLYDMKDISLSERLFITLHLLTTNVFSTEFMEESVIPKLLPAIDNMLRLFEKSACIYLQDRNQLLDKLMQHMKPAYYRIKYHLTDTILFQGTVSKEFKELHHLVKRSIGPLQDLIGVEIPDNETAYITMLIGGWMNKHGESIDKKVKAIVVCPQGVSVSRLLFNELRELFPEFVFLDNLSVRQFLRYPLEYDVVFSPINLETDKKLFVTKVFLGKEEKYRLRKQVMLGVHGFVQEDVDVNSLLEIISKHASIHNRSQLKEELKKYLEPNESGHYVSQDVTGNDKKLGDLIHHETITLVDSIDSWDEAVRLSAKPLLELEKIEERYIDAMIRYCKEDSYIVIAPGVAIPHAAPEDGANEVGMSLLRIRNGISYTNDYKIHLIIAISAVDKQQHIHALMQLMNMVGSEKDRVSLINADSINTVYEIIQKYTNK
ncbi:BglG family transcription antiterminator [Ornithinibacillus scapharcae]|uniref:BglG family transcription antiterminator n=1 Tax=Ornithinibacillus scapharcae TaxID=1147159 RepID=UPI000225BE1E|nr:BglG family transcription antiterminator [Ornithinibacillus scapharcae]